mgnify:CR=1 FL=1
MNVPPKTALVILNYNGKAYLEKFLPSIIQYNPAGVEIIIGDNASTDESIPFVKKFYPLIRIISLNKNYGYAEGYNQTLKQVDADYYFLLNSDVELKESWHPLIDFMDSNPDAAACQPIINSQSNPTHFEHAGAAGGYIDSLGYPFCKGRILDFIEENKGQYHQTSEIFWATGAALMVRSKVFHEVGAFDGDFFAHMEEIDWCWRAKNKGWKIFACPDVIVYHVGGATLSYNSPRKVLLNFRNNLSMIIKNQSTGRLWYVLPSRFVLDTIAAIKFLTEKNMGAFIAVFKAYRETFGQLSTLIKKRKQIKNIAFHNKPDDHGVLHGSILWQFYLLKRKTFNLLKGIS